MKALIEMLQIADTNNLSRQADLLERDLSAALSKVSNVNNPVSKFPIEELNNKLDMAIKRLQAARLGLGLTNKLKNPEDRKKNRSRIMKNLNLLRMIVQHVTKSLADENQEVVGSYNSVDEFGRTEDEGEGVEDHIVDRLKAQSSNHIVDRVRRGEVNMREDVVSFQAHKDKKEGVAGISKIAKEAKKKQSEANPFDSTLNKVTAKAKKFLKK